MKVILLQNVPNLGKADDVKEVSDGYARNFLFPRHLAVQASSKSLQDMAAHQTKVKKDVEKDLQRVQALAARLDGVEINMTEKANDKGVLYAAVTITKLADKLKSLGYAVDKDQVKAKPFKEAGSHKAKVVFGHGLEADFTVNINGGK